MAHKHTCLNCDAVIAEGDFDCEIDTDHDYELCGECRAKDDDRGARARPELTGPKTRRGKMKVRGFGNSDGPLIELHKKGSQFYLHRWVPAGLPRAGKLTIRTVTETDGHQAIDEIENQQAAFDDYNTR